MKIKVLEKTPNELKIEIEGEGHTLCNLLQKALLEDDTIEVAGYGMPHPLISNPIVYVRTKGRRNPETALGEAAEKMLGRSKEFRVNLKKAIEKWKTT
ncbi:MAG: DNA-directed RNA polymerase subunit L [Candidatus Bathyarchaeota archaeon BA1]|nr:MAG: DNA-directed RNA polymerase subunit L [Candidatus Bathyarchaeota archaeon BA1]